MRTFTTRTEAINFLVEQGKPLAHAKVAVNESFNYDKAGDTRDLIVHNFNFDNDDLEPCEVNERDLLQTYEDMVGSNEPYFKVRFDGYHFENEDIPMYDLDGNALSY